MSSADTSITSPSSAMVSVARRHDNYSTNDERTEHVFHTHLFCRHLSLMLDRQTVHI
jgi:hypothetical protein